MRDLFANQWRRWLNERQAADIEDRIRAELALVDRLSSRLREFAHRAFAAVLGAVGVSLDAVQDWEKLLSVGERRC